MRSLFRKITSREAQSTLQSARLRSQVSICIGTKVSAAACGRSRSSRDAQFASTRSTEYKWTRALSTIGNASEFNSRQNVLNDDTNKPHTIVLQMELDFFGEPVTFLHRDKSSISNAMAAMDSFLLCVVSKGKTCTGGGEEGGLEAKSAHSAAITWAEALRHASVWNQDENDNTSKSAPMLAVVVVAPVLAQAGLVYVKHLDALLLQTKSRVEGLPPLQMHSMAITAVRRKYDTNLNHRERLHLAALDCLLQNEFPTALAIYLRILRSCPGDALAMSLAMDLSFTLGDKDAALRYVVIR